MKAAGSEHGTVPGFHINIPDISDYTASQEGRFRQTCIAVQHIA
jgi:hypothetical protein